MTEKSTDAPKAPQVTEAQMRAAMQAYIDLFNASDSHGIAALFADNARIEDPVGGPTIIEGRAAIDAFYARAVEFVERLTLVAPIRASYGASAAMAFDISMKRHGKPVSIKAIDVMTFNAEGKIIDMKAYHGPGDASIDH